MRGCHGGVGVRGIASDYSLTREKCVPTSALQPVSNAVIPDTFTCTPFFFFQKSTRKLWQM